MTWRQRPSTRSSIPAGRGPYSSAQQVTQTVSPRVATPVGRGEHLAFGPSFTRLVARSTRHSSDRSSGTQAASSDTATPPRSADGAPTGPLATTRWVEGSIRSKAGLGGHPQGVGVQGQLPRLPGDRDPRHHQRRRLGRARPRRGSAVAFGRHPHAERHPAAAAAATRTSSPRDRRTPQRSRRWTRNQTAAGGMWMMRPNRRPTRDPANADDGFAAFYAGSYRRLLGQLVAGALRPAEAWVRRVALNLAAMAHRSLRRRARALLRGPAAAGARAQPRGDRPPQRPRACPLASAR